MLGRARVNVRVRVRVRVMTLTLTLTLTKAGECKSNAAFMKKQCPESCQKHDDGSGECLG